MKVIVSQYGARRRYLIPQILDAHGVLYKLYTDSNAYSTLGRFAKLLSRVLGNKPQLTRLIKRNPQISDAKIFSNDSLQIKILAKKLLKRPNKEIMDLIFEGSAKTFIREGVGDTDWLYTMFIENFDFTKYAKNAGVKILADIYENPYIFRELVDELNHPEFECIRYTAQNHIVQAELREKYLDELLRIADKLLVPSNYVRDCLKSSPNYDESKINVVPYVSSVANTTYANNPIKGRIIWIGNDPVRKGLLYANKAVKRLQERGFNIDFRVIGPLPSELKASTHFSNINFLGYLNKEQLREEFNSADMFVFPTLAEGFAGVLLEAASFGVPIITTAASGFEENFPGYIVPFRNVESIAKAIERLLNDRDLRNTISKNTFQYAQSFSREAFAERLLNLFD